MPITPPAPVAMIVVVVAAVADAEHVATPVPETMLAAAGFTEVHATWFVMICGPPTLRRLPVAIKACVPPGTAEPCDGVTAIDCSTGGNIGTICMPVAAWYVELPA